MTPDKVEEIIEEFAQHIIIKARFNPKEPMYGEENRRDVITLQSWLRTTLTQYHQDCMSEVVEKLEGMRHRSSKIGIGGLHQADMEMAYNQALTEAQNIIKSLKT